MLDSTDSQLAAQWFDEFHRLAYWLARPITQRSLAYRGHSYSANELEELARALTLNRGHAYAIPKTVVLLGNSRFGADAARQSLSHAARRRCGARVLNRVPPDDAPNCASAARRRCIARVVKPMPPDDVALRVVNRVPPDYHVPMPPDGVAVRTECRQTTID